MINYYTEHDKESFVGVSANEKYVLLNVGDKQEQVRLCLTSEEAVSLSIRILTKVREKERLLSEARGEEKHGIRVL